MRGLVTSAYANTPGWTEVELVGLPVKQADWAGIGKHGEPQGMVGAFTDAQTAAVARLTRGAPPIGWAPTVPAAFAAPTWQSRRTSRRLSAKSIPGCSTSLRRSSRTFGPEPAGGADHHGPVAAASEFVRPAMGGPTARRHSPRCP